MRRRVVGLRLVLAAVVSFGSVAASAVPVFAGTQGTDCGTLGDNNYVRNWENVKGITTDGNDSVYVCSDESSLFFSHTLPGNCAGGSTTWGQCEGSVTVWLATGKKVCLYYEIGYGIGDGGRGPVAFVGPLSGVRYNLTYNDALESLRFIDAGQGCL